MRTCLLLIALAGVASAEPRAKPRPRATTPTATDPGCVTKRVGGKQVCEVAATIDVRSSAAKPAVAIVPGNPRAVVGRPKSDDRLRGLGPHTR